jgi:chromate reductase
MRILGIPGSVRRGSHNRRLLRAAGDVLPPEAELVVWEGLAGLPIFDEDAEAAPPAAVRELFAAVEAADALLIATPEYNGSVPGQLKNAIDWASRPYGEQSSLWAKPAAVVSASTGGFGGVWAQQELRRILGIAGARVLSEPQLAVPHADRAGEFTHLRSRMRRILEVLAEEAAADRHVA